MKAEKKISPDATALVSAAAENFVASAAAAIAARGEFHVALAGGSTPKVLYQKLATPAYVERIEWHKVHIYFGDERCVLPDHDDSNFKMANDAMLAHVPIPAKNVHRMKTEEGVAHDVARHYGFVLEKHLKGNPFDLVLLGLGPDGHIASLFPDSDAIKEMDKMVTSLYVEKFASWRVTITYPMINAARQVIIFIAGEAKADIVRDISNDLVTDLPIQAVAPQDNYYWYMDEAANSKV
jgi:6-phosphogluconolactonase